MRLPLRTQLFVATALAALIVGGMFVWLVLAVGELRSSADRARHSEQVLASANALEKVELDTETGMRGYVITHDPGFLAPWLAARSDAPGQIAQLRAPRAGQPGAGGAGPAYRAAHQQLHPRVLRPRRRRREDEPGPGGRPHPPG